MSPGPTYGARRDDSEPGIVKAFRDGGATVDYLPGGNGRPDLLVGFLRESHLVETKTNNGKLRESQKKWADEWLGSPVVVARTPAQARKWLTVWRERVTKAPGSPATGCREGCQCGEAGGGAWGALEAAERPPPLAGGKLDSEPA